jgi:hypothetical protein
VRNGPSDTLSEGGPDLRPGLSAFAAVGGGWGRRAMILLGHARHVIFDQPPVTSTCPRQKALLPLASMTAANMVIVAATPQGDYEMLTARWQPNAVSPNLRMKPRANR